MDKIIFNSIKNTMLSVDNDIFSRVSAYDDDNKYIFDGTFCLTNFEHSSTNIIRKKSRTNKGVN